MWKEESIGHLIHLPIRAPLIELLQIADEIGARTLPSCRASVVVNIVDTALRVQATFPSVTDQHTLIIIIIIISSSSSSSSSTAVGKKRCL